MLQFQNALFFKDLAHGINVYAAWAIELPPNTPADVVDWYQKAFSTAIRSEEYREWCLGQVVFYEESELTPAGLRKHMDELRKTFLPVLEKLDLSKE